MKPVLAHIVTSRSALVLSRREAKGAHGDPSNQMSWVKAVPGYGVLSEPEETGRSSSFLSPPVCQNLEKPPDRPDVRFEPAWV